LSAGRKPRSRTSRLRHRRDGLSRQPRAKTPAAARANQTAGGLEAWKHVPHPRAGSKLRRDSEPQERRWTRDGASAQVARTSQRVRYVAREAKPATNDPPGGACHAKEKKCRREALRKPQGRMSGRWVPAGQKTPERDSRRVGNPGDGTARPVNAAGTQEDAKPHESRPGRACQSWR
jgi:hypothetical protein